MRVLIFILGLINAVYMLFDGIHVMLFGRYFGTTRPGPWTELFARFEIDIYTLGPLFIIFGLAWGLFLFLLAKKHPRCIMAGLGMSILTLWYLPLGTTISVIIFCLLMGRKRPSPLLRPSSRPSSSRRLDGPRLRV